MISSTGLVLLAGSLLSSAPAPWAESEDLTACSTDRSVCLVRSAWEVLRVEPVGAGSDPALRGGESVDLGLVGRRFPLLESWGRLDGAEVMLGNETGDQVLQELSNGTRSENRNPTTNARLPWNAESLRGFVRLEQVDHFSDATRSGRLAQLGRTELDGDSPGARKSWFGENLPSYSLLGGGIGWKGEAGELEASVLDGWIWQNLPLSDQLVGWEIRQGRIQAGWGVVHGSQSFRDLNLLGLPGSLRTLAGEAGGEILDRRLEAGLRWRWEEATGPRGRSETRSLGPWMRHRLEANRRIWSGFHMTDFDTYRIEDTLAVESDAGRVSWNLGANLLVTDRPDQLHPEVEATLVAQAPSVSRSQYRRYGLAGRIESPLGPGRISLESAPWMVRSPRAFRLDSTDSQGRFGSMRSLPGDLWGSAQSLGLAVEKPTWHARAGLCHTYEGGAAAADLDVSAPRWRTHLEGQSENPWGLAGGARVAWTSRTRVRNLRAAAWSVPPRATLDLWAYQRLGSTGWSCKAALLDLTATDQPDLPSGGRRTTRLLVAMDWQPRSVKGKP